MSFVNYLVQKKIIGKEEGEKILQRSDDPDREAEKLLQKKNIDKQKLLEMRADYLNIPPRRVKPDEVPLDILKYIPEESAVHYQFIPIGLKDGMLEVGIVDPDNIEARDALQFIASKLNLPYTLYSVTQSDFDKLLESYQSLSSEVHKALTELDKELSDEKSKDKKKEWKKAVERDRQAQKEGKRGHVVEETPITKIVAVILRHATEGNASDIHVEHTGEQVRVRFRVDGVLNTSLILPASIHNSIVARIKVLAVLRLDERRKPQDGSFTATIEGRKIDLRVSTFPAYYGEKVVLRILDPEKGVKKIEETGFRKDILEAVRSVIDRPYGLILITGPTGSGKSTTLYSMLNELDRERNNVVSLEDPVEYNIEGVSQSHVRPEIGYTFATGLRHILRQDPDIIMVGEIRDRETAQLAIQAALTGHLVFSTLHTNNAIGVVPRLVDMGIDPYLIAPTLVVAIAQRLVPKICEASKKPVPVEGATKAMVEKLFDDFPEQVKKSTPFPKQVYEAVPSEECATGTRGRTSVAELLVVTKEMERVILENPTEGAIMEVARKQGMTTMKEDTLFKAIEGVVPFREVSGFE